MQDCIVVHEPAVEIAVTGRDAGVMFVFERAFIQKLLPYSVVCRKRDVFEKLAVEHRVYKSGRLVGLHVYLNPVLGKTAQCDAESCKNDSEFLVHDMVLFHLPPIPFEEVVALLSFEYEEYVVYASRALEVARN